MLLTLLKEWLAGRLDVVAHKEVGILEVSYLIGRIFESHSELTDVALEYGEG